jgi:hypothetical protein
MVGLGSGTTSHKEEKKGLEKAGNPRVPCGYAPIGEGYRRRKSSNAKIISATTAWSALKFDARCRHRGTQLAPGDVLSALGTEGE